jgi:regulator of RNase E activity RraA
MNEQSMTPPTDDQSLFQEIRSTLYTPVVGDILDNLGRFHQFLPPPIQPMRESTVLVGRAMPVVMADCFGPQPDPFGRLTEALDQLQPGEVWIAAGADFRSANWGELLTATARMRGAAGAVVNGYHRDTPRVLEQDWPVFSRGRFAQDSAPRMKVIDFRVPIEIEGVRISPGDLIFGDLDGVLVIPRELEDQVIPQALEKARGERLVRKAIESGMSSTDAFKKFGIL